MRDPVSKQGNVVQYSFSSFFVTVEENLFILKIGIRSGKFPLFVTIFWVFQTKYFQRSVNFEMSFWCHRSDQNANGRISALASKKRLN